MKSGFWLKILLIPPLVLIATLIASLYGALHNQISFSLSPEYFTEFKFSQFRIGLVTPRLGAAIVGVRASWWLGLALALPVSLVALIQKTPRQMFWVTIKSYVLILLTAVISGIAGLIWGLIEFPQDCFNLVGTIHNFSYLGGFLGLPLGFYYQVISQKTPEKS